MPEKDKISTKDSAQGSARGLKSNFFATKLKVKKGKKQEAQKGFLPVVNIAKTNLIRFVKYKENRQSLNGDSHL